MSVERRGGMDLDAKTVKTWTFNSSVVTLDWGDVLELEGRPSGAKEGRSLLATDKKGVIKLFIDAEREFISRGSPFTSVLYSVSINPSPNGHVAIAGDTSVKFISFDVFAEVKSQRIQLGQGLGQPQSVCWAPDGQIVTVTASEGSVVNHIANFPTLNAIYRHLLAYRSSLREFTVVDLNGWRRRDTPTEAVDVQIAPEPTLIYAGLGHVGVGMNNHAWVYLYSISSGAFELVYEEDYTGTIKCMSLNSTNFAVFLDQRFSVISLKRKGSIHQQQQQQQFGINEQEQRNEESEVHVFPERGQSDADVLSVALSSDFLIYGTAQGQIEYRGLGDWVEINSYHHTLVIRSIFPNFLGNKLVFFDMLARGYVFSPTADTIMALPEVNPYEQGIVKENYATILNQDQPKLAGPLIFADSALWDFANFGIFITKSSRKIDAVTLVVSPDMYGGARITYSGCTQLAPNMESVAVHEGYLISHMQQEHFDYKQTQEWFSHPGAVLNVRYDTTQWEQALSFASQQAPDRVNYISYELTQQLEVQGEYQKASDYYRKGITNGRLKNQDEQCMGGLARTLIRTGEVRKGIDQALEIGSETVCRECASILEGMKLLDESALMYQHGGQVERAVEIYLSTRNLKGISGQMQYVKTLLLHLQYGRAREAEGSYEETIKEYLFAGDILSVARLYININDLGLAFILVRESKSAEAALVVSRFCQQQNKFEEAIQFLVVARCFKEGYDLANTQRLMDRYVDSLIRTDDEAASAIAQATEKAKQLAEQEQLENEEIDEDDNEEIKKNIQLKKQQLQIGFPILN
ncbi:MAG: putative Wdr19 protein [Streblomastix strix]|uniref:Putative Wdr19 protein n=1 Tax=Streblomastix strix TaxID=222440 RepID=A0A5J4V616_9EUKA|nr:MAG: putative Wdr19 protein [Streblomastix strix]